MRARVPRARVTHDRWLVSYADFITLLFGFFVVLFAFARADQKKQMQVTQSIDFAFRVSWHLSGCIALAKKEQVTASSGADAPPFP